MEAAARGRGGAGGGAGWRCRVAVQGGYLRSIVVKEVRLDVVRARVTPTLMMWVRVRVRVRDRVRVRSMC